MKRLSSRGKLILATTLAIFTLLSTMCASFAWFTIKNPNIRFETVTGDMNIEIESLSAYRYVYPYYEGSNTFIDYQSDKAEVRKYIIKDNQKKPFIEPDTSSREANTLNGQYYLVGDTTFIQSEGKEEYDIQTGLVLTNSGNDFLIEEATLSKGATFAITKNNKDFLRFDFVEKEETNIETIENTYFRVNTPGIYRIKMDERNKTISIHKNTRDDDAILGMTIFDPTYATFMNQKGAKAIYYQNTCLVYDVKIKVKNETHDITLSLSARRKEKPLIQTENRLPLSNYISYRTMKKPSDLNSKEIYNLFHPDGIDQDTYNTGTDSLLFPENENTITLSEQPDYQSDQKETYLNYLIAIDYSPSKIGFFFEKERLGQEYELYRDFGFYFTVRQNTEGKKDGV